MFKNFASDALGLSDIGKIIPPSQFHQTDIDDYIFHEDGEKFYEFGIFASGWTKRYE